MSQIAHLPLGAIQNTRFEVAVLPWGATEAHNRHLPYGTDTIQAEAVAVEAARRAEALGVRVAVLPAVPFGVNTTQLDIPFTLNVMPTTQLALLRDLVDSLAGQGVRKLVILNAHGGNDFKWMIRELQPRTPVFLSTINWWQVVDPALFFDEPGDHAGELETSVMMAIAPEVTHPVGQAGPGRARPWRLTGLREGWAWAPRRWTQVTDDTGIGDPKAATREKGIRFLDAVGTKVSNYLVELAAADLEHLYGTSDDAHP